jgi:hypothetical protein
LTGARGPHNPKETDVDVKSKTQMILLQFLGLAQLLMGSIPWVGTCVRLLTGLVTDHWDELYGLAQKKAGKKHLAAFKKMDHSDPMQGVTADHVRDTLQEVRDGFQVSGNDEPEGARPAGKKGEDKKPTSGPGDIRH